MSGICFTDSLPMITERHRNICLFFKIYVQTVHRLHYYPNK